MFMLEIIAIVATIAWLFISVFFESGKYFTVGLVFTAAIAVFIYSGPTIIAFILGNLNLIIIGFILYFIMGGLWSVFKWWRFNVKIKDLYNFYKTNYPSQKKAAYEGDISNSIGFRITLPPKPSDMKSNITLWIFSWPISILTWILGDFLLDIGNSFYNMLSSIYAKITKSVFGDQKFD